MVKAVWVSEKDSEELAIIKEIMRGVMESENVSAGSSCILVYADGVPVAAGVMDTAGAYGGAIKLGPVAVLEDYRRQRLGGLVMRMMVRRAYELGYNTQYVLSPPESAEFFRPLGFTRTNGGQYGLIKLKREGDITGHCG